MELTAKSATPATVSHRTHAAPSPAPSASILPMLPPTGTDCKNGDKLSHTVRQRGTPSDEDQRRTHYETAADCKIGNAARPLVRTAPGATATLSPEKFSTRAAYPTSAKIPARIPAMSPWCIRQVWCRIRRRNDSEEGSR